MTKCQFCTQPAFGPHTQPPMCERHLDLAVLCERLSERGEPVTVAAVKALLAAHNSGLLTIAPADIEPMLTGDFARRYVGVIRSAAAEAVRG